MKCAVCGKEHKLEDMVGYNKSKGSYCDVNSFDRDVVICKSCVDSDQNKSIKEII